MNLLIHFFRKTDNPDIYTNRIYTKNTKFDQSNFDSDNIVMIADNK